MAKLAYDHPRRAHWHLGQRRPAAPGDRYRLRLGCFGRCSEGRRTRDPPSRSLFTPSARATKTDRDRIFVVPSRSYTMGTGMSG